MIDPAMARSSDSEVRIGPQWRVVIPAAMRKALDLKPGDMMTARLEHGRLVFEMREQILARLKARFAAVPAEVSLVEELVAERRAEARLEEKV